MQPPRKCFTACPEASYAVGRLRPCPIYLGNVGMKLHVARRLGGSQLLTLGLLLLSRREARAVCNALPPAVGFAYRATQTTVDRPFAGPGDVVTLSLDPTCYAVERTFST